MEGFVLNIPDKMLKNLDKADAALAKLGTTADTTKENIVKAFKEINDNGLQSFIDRLGEVNKQLKELKNVKISINVDNSSKAIDNINNISNQLGKISSLSQTGKNRLKIFDLADLKRQETEIGQEIKRIEEQIRSLNPQFQNILNDRRKLSSEGIKGLGDDEIKILQKQINQLGQEMMKVGKGSGNQWKQSIQPYLDTIEQLRKKLQDTQKAKDDLFNQQMKGYAPYNDIMKQYDKLYAEIRKLDEVRQKNSKEIKSQEEYNNLITAQINKINSLKKEVNDLDLAFNKLNAQGKAFKSNGILTSDANKIAQKRASLEEEIKLMQMSTQEAQKYSDNKIKIEKREAQAIIKEAEKAEQVKIKEQEKALKESERIARERTRIEAKQNAEKINAYKVNNKKYNQTFEGAIGFSNKANTINREILAIKNLEAARNSLSKTDVNYKTKLDQLNSEILRHKQSIDEATNGAKNLQNAHKGILNTAQQLKRSLALVFSISQIQGYITKMVAVRGEFELQHRSLQAILQDKRAADEIWGKTVQLAVKSPFQLKELVTYTKQLAAYRVESDKLFDTTKMLADVSAGLGVDMQRLILAYGQVKAANYLRGTELRQFSEAGINILGELAKYFTELEGHAVSVGDVFERVSNRMVKFSDVAEIFRRLTSEGGTFYNMQEIQAETLKGQISNLKDSYAIMLNDIGKASEDALKGGVKFTRSLVENWENIADALKVVVSLFAIYKIGTIKTSAATLQLARHLGFAANAAKGTLTPIQKLRVGFTQLRMSAKAAGKALSSFVSSNWALIALSALVGTIMDLVSWNNNLKESISSIKKERNGEISQLNDLTRAYERLNKAKGDSDNTTKTTETEQTFEEKKRVFAQLQNYADENAIVIPTRLEDVTQENIDEVFGDTKELIQYAQEWGADLAVEAAKGFEGFEGLFNMFGDNLQTDLEELDESFNDISYGLKNRLVDLTDEIGRMYDKLDTTSKEYYDSIKDGQKENETELEFFQRKVHVLGIINNRLKALQYTDNAGNKQDGYELENIEALIDAQDKYKDLVIDRIEVEKELDKVANRMLKERGVSDFSHLPEEQKVMLKPEIDKVFEKLEVSESTKRIAEQYLAKKFKLEYEFTPAQKPEKALEEWQQKYNEYLKDLEGSKPNAITESDTKSNALRADLDKRIQELERDTKDYLAASKTYKEARKDDYAKMTKELENYKKMLEWLGKYEKTGGGRKPKDRMSPMIELIREMNKEYTRLNQTLDETESKQRILDSYAETFKRVFKGTGINMEDVDFIDEEGVVASLAKLRKIADGFGKEARTILEHNISQVEIDIELQTRKDQMKDLMGDLDKMMGDYEMSLELQKMNISPEAAQNLFGIESLSLPQLKERVLQFQNQITGVPNIEKFKEYLQKIDEMEKEQQQNRLKEYLEYTRDSIGERAKIKLDELRKLQEIEETFVSSPEATEEQKEAMKESRDRAKRGVTEEAEKALAKYDWEEFKKSDTFIAMFDDLNMASSKAITNMISELEKYKDEWKDMPLEDVKQLTDSLNKLQEAMVSKGNPFKAMRDIKKEIGGVSVEKAQEERANAEEDMAIHQGRIDAIDMILQATDEQIHNQEFINSLGKEYNGYLSMGKGILTDVQKRNKKEVKTDQERIDKANKILNAHKRLKLTYEAQAEALGGIQKMANDLYDAFQALNEALGVDSNSAFAILSSAGMDMTNMVLQTLQLEFNLWADRDAAEGFGLAMNTAMGVIGWIVMAIQLIAKLLTAITKIHDNRLQKQIERDAAAVAILEEKYEELAEAVDVAMSFDKYKESFDLMQKTLEDQIALEQSMLAAEEDKKKKDKEAIQDYKDKIKEDEKQMIENAEKFKEDMGGFGSEENMFKQAESFVDAWYDAFRETGSGIDALKDSYDEMIDNLMKKQIFMAVADKYIKQLTEQVDMAIGDDGIVSADELKQLLAAKDVASEELNAIMEQLAEQLGLSGGKASGLEGLSDSIQGITETTAQALEALLNSMRFYVIDNNTELKNLTNSFDEFKNLTFDAVLDELRVQTGIIDNIKDLFDSVVINASVTGGKGKALAIAM